MKIRACICAAEELDNNLVRLQEDAATIFNIIPHYTTVTGQQTNPGEGKLDLSMQMQPSFVITYSVRDQPKPE